MAACQSFLHSRLIHRGWLCTGRLELLSQKQAPRRLIPITVNGAAPEQKVVCMAEAEKEVQESEVSGNSRSALRGIKLEDVPSKRASRRKGGKATTVRRPAPEKPLIAPLNKEPSQEQVYEGYYIGALASLFVVILLQGVALSASGFFPEDIDDLVLKYVYPSFSPTIGVFLLGSSLYGLYKYLGGPKIQS